MSLAEPDLPRFEYDDALGHQSGPEPQLAALFRRHRGWLLAVLRLRFGREAAEDLLQETFLRAMRVEPESIRHPKSFLLTTALNVARDQRRRRAVRPPLTAADGAIELPEIAAAPAQDEGLLLKQVILALPPPQREVFLLSRVGGLTYEEIGRRLGLSTKTVEARMTKALSHCARHLRD